MTKPPKRTITVKKISKHNKAKIDEIFKFVDAMFSAIQFADRAARTSPQGADLTERAAVEAAQVINSAWNSEGRLDPEKSAPAAPTLPDMNKLTPRQNELISGALCSIASSVAQETNAPEILMTIRRALVSELEAVTSETTLGSSLRGVRSIDG